MIQQNLNIFFLINSLSVAILTLAFPAKFAASLSDAQEKNRASPLLRLNTVSYTHLTLPTMDSV